MASPAVSPLEQLEQQSAQAQPSTPAASSASNLSPLEQLEQSTQKQAQQAAPSGEVTNDVGNTVIVPKDGESFADTMKRAAAYGKTVTQDQINKEMASAPGKVATTLAAAPVIGAGGAASLAAPGEIAGAGERLLQLSESQLGKFAEAYPHIVKLASALGTPLTIGGIYELFQHAMSKGK